MSDKFQISPAGVVTIGHTADDGTVTYYTVPTSTDLSDQASASAAALDAVLTPTDIRIDPLPLTATSDGTIDGAMNTGADHGHFSATNGGSADNIITLPTPTNGREITLFAVEALELRSTDPTTIAINGGTGVDAESAIAAATLVRCYCTSLTTWVCYETADDGTVSATEAAAP